MLHIQLGKFEGPLALLLYLIRKEEMDIFDINIHEITRQYLDYIKLMKELDLEVASEFITMAATLIHIKSQMVLPDYNENELEEENNDPRKELVKKIIEYQKFQQISQKLYELPLIGRDVWLRGKKEDIQKPEEKLLIEDNCLYNLILMYKQIITKASKKFIKFVPETKSISQRILELSKMFKIGLKLSFNDVLKTSSSDSGTENNYHTVVSFLAILELTKMGHLQIFQNNSFSNIYVECIKDITEDVIGLVGNYNNQDAADIMENIIEKSKSENQKNSIKKEEIKLNDINNLNKIKNENPQEQNMQKQTQTQMDFLQKDENLKSTEAASDEEISAAEQEI